MVEQLAAPLDRTFAALADPTRRALLGALRTGDCSVSELAAPFPISFAAVSKHLRVLERAGLVVRRVDGRTTRCNLRAKPMQDAVEWVERYRDYWENQLDRFARYIEEEANDPSKKDRKEEKPE